MPCGGHAARAARLRYRAPGAKILARRGWFNLRHEIAIPRRERWVERRGTRGRGRRNITRRARNRNRQGNGSVDGKQSARREEAGAAVGRRRKGG